MNNITNLVLDIIRYLLDNDLNHDVNIYADNHLHCFNKENDPDFIKAHIPSGTYYKSIFETNAECEYKNDNTVTMTFEGPLYEALNYERSGKTADDLQNIFEKYGLYFELGNAWNLAAFPINTPDKKNASDNSELKTFILPVEWTVTSTVAIAARNIEEALTIYNEKENDIPVDKEADYLTDSYHLSYDETEIEECCRNNPSFYKSVGEHGVDENGKVF